MRIIYHVEHRSRWLNPEYTKPLGVVFTEEQVGRAELRGGFAECFRVLRPGGTLIFKWNEIDVPLREILALTPEKPLYGHKSGKLSKTHWVAFLKPNDEAHPARPESHNRNL